MSRYSDTGRDKMRTCLAKMDDSINIDDLILYKYGNKKTEAYKGTTVEAKLNDAEYEKIDNVAAVVKYFLESGIFVAWRSGAGKANGKYSVRISDLTAFEASECSDKNDYKEIITGNKDHDRVWLFRNDSGIEKFFSEVLGIKRKKGK